MINKIIITGLVCLFSCSSVYAQKTLQFNLPGKKGNEVSPVVKEKVEEYATKINTIIQEEKTLMDAELKFFRLKIWTKLNLTNRNKKFQKSTLKK